MKWACFKKLFIKENSANNELNPPVNVFSSTMIIFLNFSEYLLYSFELVLIYKYQL